MKDASEISSMAKIEFLKNINIFSTLNENAIDELGMLVNEIRTRAQEVIVKKDDPGQDVFIIYEGEVRVHDGNHVIARLHSGELFGEFSMIDNEKRSASVTAEKPCVLLCIRRIDLLPFMAKYPEFVWSMLHSQVKRMRDMNVLEDKLAKSFLKISKQKQEIEAQNNAITQQKRMLEEQNLQLAALSENKRKLVSVLIHGLKNPLTSAMMTSEMLEQYTENTIEAKEVYYLLKQSLLRMDEVFNQIIQSNQKNEAS